MQVDPGDHFGREHRGPDHLDPVPRGVQQMSHHLERQGIRLVSCGTRYDPDPGVGAGLAHGEVPGVPLRGSGSLVGENVEDLAGRLSHELRVTLAQQTAIVVLLGIVELGEDRSGPPLVERPKLSQQVIDLILQRELGEQAGRASRSTSIRR